MEGKTRVIISERIEKGDFSRRPSKSSTVERTVTELLHEMGVPANVKGYQYLREAVMMSVDRMDILHAVTKKLYPDIANRFQTTASRVERAMRHAIELAWNRGNLDVLEKYFGYTVSDAKGKPTNSEFIAMLADMISLDQRVS